MEDFLGTSIQYAERQLLALENEYDNKMEQNVEDLIESGFLDSDYDGSSGEYYTSDEDLEVGDYDIDDSCDIKDESKQNESNCDILDCKFVHQRDRHKQTNSYLISQNAYQCFIIYQPIVIDHDFNLFFLVALA